MAHSFSKVYIHIIFSTKERRLWLDDSIRARVHAYIATLARDAGCPFAAVGGPDDHIHILVDMGKKVHLIEMIGRIKQESSKFVKTLGAEYHRRQTFQDEFRAFLNRYGIEYDEQYVWG